MRVNLTYVFVGLAAVLAAVLIWSMLSPLLGLSGGRLNDPASAGAPR
ncbi:MAG: hypothetical protein ACHQ2Z_08060 [Elusimicrobiota bacterium]